jgi:hypothetical protein
MISNIRDLIIFSRKSADEVGYPLPKSEDPVWSEYDSCTIYENEAPNIIERLQKAFPNLPESYVSFIKKYEVRGVSIGRWELSVCSSKKEDFVEEMLEWNDPENIRSSIARKHDLYYWGSDGGDEYFVAGKESDFNEGEILAIDHEEYFDEEVSIRKMAESYEQFLIICGNLYQVSRDESLDEEEKIEEMKIRLKTLELEGEYVKSWIR